MVVVRVKRKKGHAYVARVYTGTKDGKRKEINKTFKTEKEAKAFEAQSYNYKHNKISNEISDKVIFSEVARKYFEKLEKSKTKINTIRSYKSKYTNWIEERLGYIQIGKISHLTITRLIDQLENDGISESSLFVVFVVLKNIFNFATDSLEKYVIENPMRYIKLEVPDHRPITKLKYYDSDEITKYIKAAGDSPYYWAIIFALNTGLRFGELASVEEDDIDFDSRTLSVFNKLVKYTDKSHLMGSTYLIETPKGNKGEMIPLNEAAIKAAKEAIKAAKGNRFIFCPGNTEPKKFIIIKSGKEKVFEARIMIRETFEYAIHSIADKAQVKRLGAHGFRHTFAYHYLRNGGDVFKLSKFLRHASVNTTIRSYGHLCKDLMNSSISLVTFGANK